LRGEEKKKEKGEGKRRRRRGVPGPNFTVSGAV